MTTDISASKEFYSELLAWTTRDMLMEDMNYTVIKVEDQEVAGMIPMPADNQEMPPSWGIYITVIDVDKTASKAKELGGKILVEPKLNYYNEL